MINIRIKEKADRILSYEVSGHAEFDEPGYDIVCAAVSILSITTANNLHKMAQILPKAEMDDDGYIKVELPVSLSKIQTEQAQFIMLFFKNAMYDVVAEYSEFVEIEEVE